MSNILIRESAPPRRRWRSGVLVASCAVVALTAAACGGGGSSDNSAAGNDGGTSSAAADCGGTSTDPYPGLEAAEAPDVTANPDEAKLPEGTPGKDKPGITLGSKNFPEQTLLGELYGQALQAKGFTVKLQPQIGASEVIDKAFESNQIDMYPEYLGEIATSLADNPPQPDAKTTFESAKKYEQDKHEATIFKQTPYQNVDIVLVKPDFCKQNNLESLDDLKQIGDNGAGVTFAAQGAAKTRYSGFKGLQEAYGLTNAQFVGVPTGGATLDAVKGGQANLADGFSTTTAVVEAVKKGEFVVLKDPKHIMGFQHVAPIVKQSVEKAQGPDFENTLDWVSAQLSLDAMNAMNEAVEINRVPEKEVAQKFLSANGLK